MEATSTPLTWTSDNPSVVTVEDDGTITAVSEGEAMITVETENGNKATTLIIVDNKPKLRFNTYAAITSFNVIQQVSTSFLNMSKDTVTVEKIEVYEGDIKRSTYTKADLISNKIPVEISPYGNFGISISFKIGLWSSSNNFVKYTISDGNETFEYISEL